ncbi:MAG: hypothetical protein K2P17_00485 [Helicobacteraceae bacterium]|nr:hypothetical protein [Helicobacteraceae bacterium]
MDNNIESNINPLKSNKMNFTLKDSNYSILESKIGSNKYLDFNSFNSIDSNLDFNLKSNHLESNNSFNNIKYLDSNNRLKTKSNKLGSQVDSAM